MRWAIRMRRAEAALDRTHLNAHGSEVFGRMVADDLARMCPELGPDVKGQAMPATGNADGSEAPLTLRIRSRHLL